MSFPRLTQIRFTQAEFGALQSIYQALKIAKTKKEATKLTSSIHSYIKSLSSNGILKNIPKNFKIFSIREEVDTINFPSEIGYDVTIIWGEEEAEDGKQF